MKKINSLLIILFLFNSTCNAQEEDTLYVAFWNLQNLFDTVDDPEKNDESFLPDGDMEFTPERLDKQMYNLSRVIHSMNSGNGPDLLGVCEVENQAVLSSIVNKFLPELDYKIAYLESPDNRGIDNGLLFEIGNLYQLAGANDRYVDIANEVERNALLALERNPGDVNSYYNPYRLLLEVYENLKEYNKLVGIWQRLEILYPNDPSVKASIQKYQQLAAGQDSLSN